MEMFLNSQEISLQEMLDRDMKSEIDDVFGHSELSLSLSELPPLDLDESFTMPMWLSAGNSNSSSSNFHLDFAANDGAAKMVDPTSVMPCLNVQTGGNNFVGADKNYVIMSSPSMSPDVKDEPLDDEDDDVNVDNFEVTSFSDFEDVDIARYRPVDVNPEPRAAVTLPQRQTIRIATSAASLETHTFANSFRNGFLKSSSPIVTTTGKLPLLQHGELKTVQTIQIRDVRTLNVQPTAGVVQKKLTNKYVELDYDEKAYPKPAYSYSCLIAMALKNSATGSLPVSEIYNFMCEHFPYFKTAPNGWKNSVRHNLSLNKCFEKIEKPAGNGSQRKGCLWAMNPNKVTKMDEEVQKWSKKDPMAIKKAMVNPEHLEMLERGDLKRDFMTQTSTGSSGGSPSESSDDEGIMSPQTPLTPQSRPREYADVYNMESDSSSEDTEFDEVADDLFEELDADDENLNLGVTLTPAGSQGLLSLASNAVNSTSRLVQQQPQQQQTVFANKRHKVAATSIHGNYVYQPMTSGWGNGPLKRKTPLLLRTSTNTMGSSLIKVDDSA